MASPPIILRVGEKQFYTTSKTLRGSGMLSTLLEQWEHNKEEDESYFVDADPDIFQHILRYLRLNLFPVIYDPSKGHNFPLYNAVLHQGITLGVSITLSIMFLTYGSCLAYQSPLEIKSADSIIYLAKYFAIPKLVDWLEQKRYLTAIEVTHSAELLEAESWNATADAAITKEYYPAWKKERVYVCPRAILSHRGNPRACGRQCRNRQGDREDEYEDELTLTTLAISKKVVFHEELCQAEEQGA